MLSFLPHMLKDTTGRASHSHMSQAHPQGEGAAAVSSCHHEEVGPPVRADPMRVGRPRPDTLPSASSQLVNRCDTDGYELFTVTELAKAKGTPGIEMFAVT